MLEEDILVGGSQKNKMKRNNAMLEEDIFVVGSQQDQKLNADTNKKPAAGPKKIMKG